MAKTTASVEVSSIPRGIDRISFRVYFAILVNVAERFTYYGLTIPFQNFVQNSYKSEDHARPGVLGAGQATATAVTNAFIFLQTIMSLCGAVAADGGLGRYKTLLICSLTYMVGNLLLVIISTPVAIEHGAAPAGFAVSLVLIAIGAGGFQSAISAFIGDQYCPSEQDPITRKDGSVYMPDRDLTLQFIYNLNYWGLNLGAMSGIATTFLELYYGFWAAFLLPLCGLWIAPITLILGRKAFARATLEESTLLRKSKILAQILKRRTLSALRLSPQASVEVGSDGDVEDVKAVLRVCRVLLVFIVVWVCLDQMSNNFITQAGQMQTNGLPNDLMWSAIPILIVLLLPIVQWLLSSVLPRYRIPFRPMARISVGCLFVALAMAYVAILQHLIYNSGPCYRFPTECNAAQGGPNDISVWLQIPAYVLIVISEVLALATGYKYAYEAAPPSLKALVQAIFLLAAGIAGAICIAIAPAARNPHLVIMYACLAGSMFLATGLFAGVYWRKEIQAAHISQDDDNSKEMSDQVETEDKSARV